MNKKKKYILSILSVLLVFSMFFSLSLDGDDIGNNDKSEVLTNSVSIEDPAKVTITCDKKNITINKQVSCTLNGHRTGGILGVYGEITYSDGLDFNISENTELFAKESEDPLEILYFSKTSNSIEQDDVLLANITITGTSLGEQTITFKNSAEEENAYFVVGDPDNALRENVENYTLTLNVTEVDTPDEPSNDNNNENNNTNNNSNENKNNETKTNSICKISSNKYEIDNNKKIINVELNVSDNDIINNIKSDGNVSISGNTLTAKCNDVSTNYEIRRYYVAKTGNKIIKYSLIIGGIIISIIILFILKKKIKK